MMPSGLISTSSGSRGASKIVRAVASKAVDERPWKERDQSTVPSVEADGVGSAGGSGAMEVGGAEEGAGEDEAGLDGACVAVVKVFRGGKTRGFDAVAV